MTLGFDIVTIDSPTPLRLAAFWARVLGLVEMEREGGDRWVLLGAPDGTRRIGFQRGAHRPGGVHLDLRCDTDEFHDTVAALRVLGAEEVRPVRQESYGWIANLRDPDGNVFDVCAYISI